MTSRSPHAVESQKITVGSDLGASGVTIIDPVLIDTTTEPDAVEVESTDSPTLGIEADTEVKGNLTTR